MQVTITKFRQELFRLADDAISGTPVQFVYKGVVFQVIPEGTEAKKLDRLVGQPTLAAEGDPGSVDLKQASKELAAEMEAEWLQDWSEI